MMPVSLLFSAGIQVLSDPDAQAYFARCSGLTTTEQTNITNLIGGLKSDGLWSMLDVIIVPSSLEANSRLNIKQAAYDITNVGGCTWTANQGWTTATTGSKYLNSNWRANSPTTLAASDNVTAFIYRRTFNHAAGLIYCDYGSSTSGAYDHDAYFDNDTSRYHQITNSGVDTAYGVYAGAMGLLATTRAASQTSLLVSVPSLQYIPNNLTNPGNIGTVNNLFIGARNVNGASVDRISDGNQYACWGAGKAMTQSQLNKLYQRIQTYMTAVGSQV